MSQYMHEDICKLICASIMVKFIQSCGKTGGKSKVSDEEWRQGEVEKRLEYALVKVTQPAFTCSKLTKETLEQGVKYVKS